MGQKNSNVKTQQQSEQSEHWEQSEEIFNEEPWRSFETGGGWTTEYCDRLINDIKSIKHLENVEFARIAIFGIAASGKSSFLNSIACIEKGRISTEVNISSARECVTLELAQYVPRTLGSNFVLLDTMGIEVEAGIDMNETKHLIDGNLAIGHRFNSGQSFETKDLIMQKVAHCIVIVVDAQLIDTDSIDFKRIEILQKQARDADVRTILLLTKIDEVCPELKKDLKKVYYSRKMKEIVLLAKERLRLPLMQIFPVRNYAEETGLNLEMNILLLLALRQMVRSANDRINHVANQKFVTTSSSETSS